MYNSHVVKKTTQRLVIVISLSLGGTLGANT